MEEILTEGHLDDLPRVLRASVDSRSFKVVLEDVLPRIEEL